MNKQRRERIRDLINQLEQLRAEVDEILDEEQGYFDAMPASFQDGERGEKAQEAISQLGDAGSNIQDAIDNLEI